MTETFDLIAYLRMIADEERTDAYCAALSAVGVAGRRLLDVGAGFGYFSILACQLGATEVLAVEMSPEIDHAAKLADGAGVGTKLKAVRGPLSSIQSPSRFDVVLSDLRGALPLFGHAIPTVIDARERFLASGGTLIPQRDRIWIAPVNAGGLYEERIALCQATNGVPTEPLRASIVRMPWRVALPRESLLGSPALWLDCDYYMIQSSNHVHQVAWTVDEPASCDGFALWFDAELTNSVSFTNAPGTTVRSYGQWFLPAERPMSIQAGEHLSVTVSATSVAGRYAWAWHYVWSDANRGTIANVRLQNLTLPSPERRRAR